LRTRAAERAAEELTMILNAQNLLPEARIQVRDRGRKFYCKMQPHGSRDMSKMRNVSWVSNPQLASPGLTRYPLNQSSPLLSFSLYFIFTLPVLSAVTHQRE
uniref:Ig-like domain-containing protein n=1 Tax=Angiostrongylus cantonensis TaxID=6313 RepID=A0A0K0DIP5_ANGCA